MLTNERFVEEWTRDGSKLETCPPSALEGVPLDADSRTFLTDVGLPETAPPFLKFGFPKTGRLETVVHAMEIDEDEVEDDEDRALVKELWVIGADGSGDRIGIGKDGRVVVFDHTVMACLPVASSLLQLASSLAAYRAYSQGGRAEELVHKGEVEEGTARLRGVVKALRDIDAKAYDASGFWQRQLGQILVRIGQDHARGKLGLELAEILAPPR
jgi:hypothetical protein